MLLVQDLLPLQPSGGGRRAQCVQDTPGGAFNPAVGTGPIVVHALVNGGSLSNLWIYWLGPLLGGALAAGVFRLQEKSIK